MDRLRYFKAIVELLDLTLSTKSKRHLVGGGLLGLAMLFGTMAVTVMTTNTEKMEETNHERNYDEAVDILSGMSGRTGDEFCDPEEAF